MENKKISVKNIYLILLISLSLVGLAIGSTYAMFTASATIDDPITIASNLSSEEELVETVDITVDSGETKASTLNLTNTTENTLNYSTWYNANSNDVEVSYDKKGDTPTGTIAPSDSKSVTLMIKNSGSAPANVNLGVSYNKNSIVLDSNMTAITTQYKKEPTPLVTHITNLYTNATKAEVINNSITYNYANIYDTNGGLMNDRLGGTTTSLDDGNIRYYGANPNNYIYFNCSDYTNQSADTCEIWRIIGVFKDIELGDGTKKDLVKIIRNDSIESLAWDQDKNIDSSLTTYDNDWSTASLQVLLNTKYYEGKETVTYYSGGTGATSTTLNMASIGLKKDVTRNKIAEVEWNLGGGFGTAKTYSDVIYNSERGTEVYNGGPTVWKEKIALMYLSDYGYGTDFTKCSQYLSNYKDSICASNDWLKIGTQQWLLVADLRYSNFAWTIVEDGSAMASNVRTALSVRPTLYLSSEQGTVAGDGSSGSPYQLGA